MNRRKADAVVARLNELGYQPVFLPIMGVVPPDLYCMVDSRLVRYGPLAHYVRGGGEFPMEIEKGKAPDITHVYTSQKRFSASLKFMKAALQCLGVSFAPEFSLSGLKDSRLVFAISGLTTVSVSAGHIEFLVRSLDPILARKSAPSGGELHIVHEYLYAEHLLIHRKAENGGGIELAVEKFAELETNAHVAQVDEFTISFAHPSGSRVACAYRAGWLRREGSIWNFLPNVVMRATLGAATEGPYIPAEGQVLWVEPGNEPTEG
ncbi:hypothetical protein [Nannocystis sp. SCPEA4]|uniref:hypothetical protein n=1 Tax=Nannocystis sp. SCPEA4 TaxID=2996787 RepID=UPI002271AF59|nr:hypothetical protein [Nannocystis sp. SCPEA4]MCY1059916.1 hypothetical protein [Nannocystis sp. SCPEA4]